MWFKHDKYQGLFTFRRFYTEAALKLSLDPLRGRFWSSQDEFSSLPEPISPREALQGEMRQNSLTRIRSAVTSLHSKIPAK